MLAWSLSAADRPAPEREYTIRSSSGTYEFAMQPGGPQGSPQPYGEAFDIAQGERILLWRVTGWYAPQTFISNDGRSLVRMGPWASKPITEELALAFYRDGQELKRYVVADLISDENSVQRSVSHYTWQAQNNESPGMIEDGRFQLQTVEGKLLTFDLATGEISDSEADAPDLSGVWQGGPCGGRSFTRTLHLNSDNTFEVTDRGGVTFQGSWRTPRPTMIVLVPATSTHSRDPLARYLALNGDVLNEATPGDPIICKYSRPGTTPD
jgi:hypothetical protein